MTKKNAAPNTVWITHQANTASLWVPILGGIDVERGVPVEAPADIAARLLEQEIWIETSAPADDNDNAENGANA